MTARSSDAENDAKARLRATARHEQMLVLAAIKAADKIGSAQEQEHQAARAAAHQLALARHSHAVAVVALADAVGDDRAGFVLGITAKEMQTHRRTARSEPAPRPPSQHSNHATHTAATQPLTTARRRSRAEPSLFDRHADDTPSTTNTTSPMAPAVSAATAADTTR
jgi:hypothetical protein